MFKDEVLENEKRRDIYAIIEANPGIHLRELQRVLNMPLATLEYHLSYMTRKRLFLEKRTDIIEDIMLSHLSQKTKRYCQL